MMVTRIDANRAQRLYRRARGLRRERTITRTTWSGEWPFLVSRGTLVCDSSAVTFVTRYGYAYALNGSARARMKLEGWRDGDDIVRWDDDGRPISLRDVIGYGLNL